MIHSVFLTFFLSILAGRGHKLFWILIFTHTYRACSCQYTNNQREYGFSDFWAPSFNEYIKFNLLLYAFYHSFHPIDLDI